MSQNQPMRIRVTVLLGWALPAVILAWAAGVYPTWQWAGSRGLAAQAVAAATVLTVLVANAAMVKFAAAAGPARAATMFMVGSAARIGLCLGAVAGARVFWKMPTVVLLAWMCLFYVIMVSAEGRWLVRALKQNARRTAPDGIRQAKSLGPESAEGSQAKE